MYKVSCFYHKMHDFFTYLPHYKVINRLSNNYARKADANRWTQSSNLSDYIQKKAGGYDASTPARKCQMPTYTHNAIFINSLIFQITSNNGKARKCQMPTYTHNAIFINILISQITYHRKLGVMTFPHQTTVRRGNARCQHVHTTLFLL